MLALCYLTHPIFWLMTRCNAQIKLQHEHSSCNKSEINKSEKNIFTELRLLLWNMVHYTLFPRINFHIKCLNFKYPLQRQLMRKWHFKFMKILHKQETGLFLTLHIIYLRELEYRQYVRRTTCIIKSIPLSCFISRILDVLPFSEPLSNVQNDRPALYLSALQMISRNWFFLPR